MDIIMGATIKFTEQVYGGSFKNPKHLGEREITAVVLRDSYGGKRGQHSFTLEVTSATGCNSEEILKKKKIRRMGRNVYPTAIIISEPVNAEELAAEKHARAAAAKEAKYRQWLRDAEEGNEFKLDKIPVEFLKKNWAEIEQRYFHVAHELRGIYHIGE